MDMIESRGDRALRAAGACMVALGLIVGLGFFATTSEAPPLTQEDQRLLTAIDIAGAAFLAQAQGARATGEPTTYLKSFDAKTVDDLTSLGRERQRR